jgi:hypothetical protein
MRKLISAVLTVILVIGLMPPMPAAAEAASTIRWSFPADPNSTIEIELYPDYLTYADPEFPDRKLVVSSRRSVVTGSFFEKDNSLWLRARTGNNGTATLSARLGGDYFYDNDFISGYSEHLITFIVGSGENDDDDDDNDDDDNDDDDDDDELPLVVTNLKVTYQKPKTVLGWAGDVILSEITGYSAKELTKGNLKEMLKAGMRSKDLTKNVAKNIAVSFNAVGKALNLYSYYNYATNYNNLFTAAPEYTISFDLTNPNDFAVTGTVVDIKMEAVGHRTNREVENIRGRFQPGATTPISITRRAPDFTEETEAIGPHIYYKQRSYNLNIGVMASYQIDNRTIVSPWETFETIKVERQYTSPQMITGSVPIAAYGGKCPMDIIISDAQGQFIGRVSNHSQDAVVADGLYAFAEDETKWVYVEIDKIGNYQIQTEGTAEGEALMFTFICYPANGGGDFSFGPLTIFAEVPLAAGRMYDVQMSEKDAARLFEYSGGERGAEIESAYVDFELQKMLNEEINSGEHPLPEPDKDGGNPWLWVLLGILVVVGGGVAVVVMKKKDKRS